jgi:hypothetical protein
MEDPDAQSSQLADAQRQLMMQQQMPGAVEASGEEEDVEVIEDNPDDN